LQERIGGIADVAQFVEARVFALRIGRPPAFERVDIRGEMLAGRTDELDYWTILAVLM
jgi:hypothetical protein